MFQEKRYLNFKIYDNNFWRVMIIMYSTVLQYLEETALKFPNKIAFADTKEAFTFSELLNNAKK